MVKVLLGDRLADWNTRQTLWYPWVTCRKNRALLFFLEQSMPKRETKNQYLLVKCEIETSYGTFETPMECKFFPGIVPMFFSVAVPNGSYDATTNVRVVLYPKEIIRQTATHPQLEIELSYDDEDLTGVSCPLH